jgi:hypothetical protein
MGLTYRRAGFNFLEFIGMSLIPTTVIEVRKGLNYFRSIVGHSFGWKTIGVPKSGSSVQHILSLGIFDYACDIVRHKEFISSTVTGTQVSYKEYPMKGYGAAPMA